MEQFLAMGTELDGMVVNGVGLEVLKSSKLKFANYIHTFGSHRLEDARSKPPVTFTCETEGEAMSGIMGLRGESHSLFLNAML